MRVFILFDSAFPAYPLLGVYSTLEKARAAVVNPDEGTKGFLIYEEVLDEAGEVTEPVVHEVRPKEPT